MNAGADPIAGVLSAWFTKAKTWWGLATGAQLVGALVGAVAVLFDQTPAALAITLAAISVSASTGAWRSDRLKQRAEFLLRHVEFRDSFGWEIDPKLIADTLADAIPDRALANSRGQEQGSFYSSSFSVGPQRALGNLSESAWWTQHLASFMAWIATISCAIVGLLALWSLLVAADLLDRGSITVSAVVTAVLALIFSANLLRLPVEYFALSSQAKAFDEMASRLLRQGATSEVEAVRVFADYQLVRASSPLLPDWVWRYRRKHLNATWSQYRHN